MNTNLLLFDVFLLFILS